MRPSASRRSPRCNSSTLTAEVGIGAALRVVLRVRKGHGMLAGSRLYDGEADRRAEEFEQRRGRERARVGAAEGELVVERQIPTVDSGPSGSWCRCRTRGEPRRKFPAGGRCGVSFRSGTRTSAKMPSTERVVLNDRGSSHRSSSSVPVVTGSIWLSASATAPSRSWRIFATGRDVHPDQREVEYLPTNLKS